MAVREYEMVLGLEVHIELKTKSKIFCGCSTAFGARPNTQCCPVCAGLPGALPVLNRQAVEYAIKAGLATHCTVARFSRMDRKNYLYPDLPNAYQISQHDLPLCTGGYIEIDVGGVSRKIGITRIHLEEDAGKLLHLEGQGTLIDLNRCGVPLIEIVSEPEIYSAEEAKAYLQKLRAVILYTGISDCKMNEGSLRCDVNLSIRPKGQKTLGTRTELKNLNSFQFVQKAIEYEYKRQVQQTESGRAIEQETRRFDEKTGKTVLMRRKENADDYRYFPEPDLPPIEVSNELLVRLQSEIPPLPDARKIRYVMQMGLSSYAAEQLVLQREIADYFEEAAAYTKYPVLLSNLLLGEVFRLLPPQEMQVPISPCHLAGVAQLLGEGKINSSTSRTVIEALWQEDQEPAGYVKREGLLQITDEKTLLPLVKEALAEQPKSVQSYQAGKTAALQALVGQVMKKTKGRGDPAKIRKLLLSLIKA